MPRKRPAADALAEKTLPKNPVASRVKTGGNTRRDASARLFFALENDGEVAPDLINAAFSDQPSVAAHRALRLAVERRNLDAIRLLLPLNDESVLGRNEPTLIFKAADLRFPEALALLVHARDPSRRADECARALIGVVMSKWRQPGVAIAIECLRVLLPFWQDAWTLPHSSTLVHAAAEMADPAFLRDVLARSEGDVDRSDSNQRTPLVCSILAGRDPALRDGALACVRLLLPLSAVFGRGHFGHDALHAACQPGQEEFVSAILERLDPHCDWHREEIDHSLRAAADLGHWGCADALAQRANPSAAARAAALAPRPELMPRWSAFKEAQALGQIAADAARAVAPAQPDSAPAATPRAAARL